MCENNKIVSNSRNVLDVCHEQKYTNTAIHENFGYDIASYMDRWCPRYPACCQAVETVNKNEKERTSRPQISPYKDNGISDVFVTADFQYLPNTPPSDQSKTKEVVFLLCPPSKSYSRTHP